MQIIGQKAVVSYRLWFINVLPDDVFSNRVCATGVKVVCPVQLRKMDPTMNINSFCQFFFNFRVGHDTNFGTAMGSTAVHYAYPIHFWSLVNNKLIIS